MCEVSAIVVFINVCTYRARASNLLGDVRFGKIQLLTDYQREDPSQVKSCYLKVRMKRAIIDIVDTWPPLPLSSTTCKLE